MSYYFGRPSEQNFLQYFRPRSGWVVAVVGAFVGYYVLIASKMVGSKGKVLAFEPEPRNFAILLKNIRDNKLTDVVIPLRLALSDKDGYELLTLSSQPPMHSIVPIPHLSHAYKDSKIIVKARRLDSLLEELHLRRVDLLKIDVGGAELKVLKGAEKTLSDVKLCLVEVHTKLLEKEVRDFLEERGFYVKKVSDIHLVAYRSSERKVL